MLAARFLQANGSVEDAMEQTKEQLLNQLLDTAKLLSPDKLLEALDFVRDLYYRSSSASRPAR